MGTWLLRAARAAPVPSSTTFEVFDPESGAFSSPGVLSAARAEHAAAVAGASKVIVAGGRNAGGVLASADIIDVSDGSVAPVVLTAPRAGASATALLDGKILVAGGSDGANQISRPRRSSIR